MKLLETSLYWAHMETRSFDFDTFGISEATARNLMRSAWEKHCKQTGCPTPWSEVEDGVGVTEVKRGTMLRDRDTL
jgi:hypothetical protein